MPEHIVLPEESDARLSGHGFGRLNHKRPTMTVTMLEAREAGRSIRLGGG